MKILNDKLNVCKKTKDVNLDYFNHELTSTFILHDAAYMMSTTQCLYLPKLSQTFQFS